MSDIRIENVRLSFASLMEPYQHNGKGEAAFVTDALVPKDDAQVKLIKATMLEVATEKWGEKGRQVLKMLVSEGKTFFRDGDTKINKDGEAYEGYPDHIYLKARNKVRPLLLDRNEKPIDALKGKDIPYGGCYAHIIINVWAQDNEYGRRINAKLLGVMFAAEGEPFGSGPQRASASAFAGLSSSDGELDEPDGFEDDEDLGF